MISTLKHVSDLILTNAFRWGPAGFAHTRNNQIISYQVMSCKASVYVWFCVLSLCALCVLYSSGALPPSEHKSVDSLPPPPPNTDKRAMLKKGEGKERPWHVTHLFNMNYNMMKCHHCFEELKDLLKESEFRGSAGQVYKPLDTVFIVSSPTATQRNSRQGGGYLISNGSCR